jgi:hypothetical protein
MIPPSRMARRQGLRAAHKDLFVEADIALHWLTSLARRLASRPCDRRSRIPSRQSGAGSVPGPGTNVSASADRTHRGQSSQTKQRAPVAAKKAATDPFARRLTYLAREDSPRVDGGALVRKWSAAISAGDELRSRGGARQAPKP